MKKKTPEPGIPPAAEDIEEIREKVEAQAAEAAEKFFPPSSPQVGAMPESIKRLGKEKTKTKKEVQLYPLDFEGLNPPQSLKINKVYGSKEYIIPRTTPVRKTYGILHLAGRGRLEPPVPVMFISPCVLQEELSTATSTKPMMVRGAPGNLFMRCLERVGIKNEDWYYTAIAKYNTPKLKITQPDINWGLPALEEEIDRLKPQIIVCLGKQVFDFFMAPRKFKMAEVQGGFFYSEKYNCQIFPMDGVMTPLYKPEYLERFEIDLQQVKFAIDDAKGVKRIIVTQNYHTIEKAEHLAGLMMQLKAKQRRELAVDCEWAGQTAWSGRLRSFQFCWAPGEAAYLRLMNDKMEYAFDRPIETVRQILNPVMNDPQVKFIGHNGSADMPWMDEHLGINVYKRFIFDTMYAQHTVNEYADLKLERLSVKFTDLGRYDIPLAIWKKDNKFGGDDSEGYGKIPDRILIPYGLRDVDATFRSRGPLFVQIVRAGLLQYFNQFLLPFVTDGFYELMSCGLPINMQALDEMRDTFSRNQQLMMQAFMSKVKEEAYAKLRNAIATLYPKDQDPKEFSDEIIGLIQVKDPAATAQAEAMFNSLLKKADIKAQMFPIFTHAAELPLFSLNSTKRIRRWLFDVKGLKPLKTTKKNGIQLSWEKVERMEKKQRDELNPQPSTDKATLKIFAEQDPVIAELQELKSVENILKAFLGGIEDEEGLDKGIERGLHKWVQPDGRIHANFSLTETARPRSWKPNVLNWPKAVTKPIEKGFERIAQAEVALLRKKYEAIPVENEKDRVAIEAEIQRQQRKPTSLRANVQAPEGWCIIDMDLKTAEVVALAYQSGDENMIKVLTEPDTQFARIDKDNPKKVVRVAFNENENITQDAWDESLIVSTDDPRILRHPDGSIMHPKRDLHWEMGCGVVNKPREKCDERLVRDGCGKVGNFSIPYGASAGLLNRLIETNTGIKPDSSTGDDMVEAWNKRYKKAHEFLLGMEEIVLTPGYWRSLSGRVRHFQYAAINDVQEFSEYKKKGIRQGLARQARNFPMQELVAATTGKSLLMFIEGRREMKLQSRIGILLYDAMTAFAPLTEAKAAEKLLRECLTTRCQWNTKGGLFNFEVDTTIGFRWGVKATKEEKQLIESYMK